MDTFDKNYMNPQNANPQNFIVHDMLYTSPDTYFSIAVGEWVEEGEIRFALRWNVDINDPSDHGFPSVFGHPMWFQLPYDIRDIVQVLTAHSDATGAAKEVVR